MTVIPAVGRWEAGDQEFKAILGYVESSGPALGFMRSCLKETKQNKSPVEKVCYQNEHV